MPVFNGVHGTTETDGHTICKTGFKIPSHSPGHCMYGNGVYFYRDSPEAERAALIWGQQRRQIFEDVCLIKVKISYESDDLYQFPIKHFNKIVRLEEEKRNRTLNKKEKNTLRELYIQEAICKLKITARIVLAKMPAFRRNLPACVIRDTGLLPPSSQYVFELRGEPWRN